MDFDDLIAKTVEVMQRHPEVRAKYRSRFKHILVDEYQDTNHAQYVLITRLKASGTASASEITTAETLNNTAKDLLSVVCGKGW